MHNGITWHNFIYISVQTAPLRAARQILYKRDFKKFNEADFINDFTENAQEILNPTEASVNESANDLEAKITPLVDKHTAFKKVRVRPTRKPWITSELLKTISKKNAMFKSVRNNSAQWPIYKEFRNYVLHQIRQAKP